MGSKNGKVAPVLSVAQQIYALKELGQGAAAYILGVSSRTIRDTPSCPRSPSGSYDAAEVVRFFRDRDIAHATAQQIVIGPAGESDIDDLLADLNSPALELVRKHRATLTGFQVDEARGNLIKREEIRSSLANLANLVRVAGERLEREFGAPARAIIDDALHTFENEILKRTPTEKSNDS
jgi:hypothetical protein